jgi:hypothetical protein
LIDIKRDIGVLLALREDIIEEKPLKIDKRHEKVLSWFG